MTDGTIASARIAAAVPGAISRLYRRRSWLTFVALMSSDVAAAILAVLVFRIGRPVPEIAIYGSATRATPLDLFYILFAFFVLVRTLSGDYGRRVPFWDGARATTIALLITAVPDLIVLGIGWTRYGAFSVLGTWLFLLVAVPTLRQGARAMLSRIGMWRTPTALIASGDWASDIFVSVGNSLSLGYDMRWLVLESYEQDVPGDLTCLKPIYLSDPEDIAQKLSDSGCVQTVVATGDVQTPAFSGIIQRLMESDIAVAFIPSLRRLPLVGVTAGSFLGRDILLFQVRNNLRYLPHRFVKRAFDIIGSLALILFFLPVFAVIALAIKLHDGGKIIYKQKRTGRNGMLFFCPKFRTMAEDADERLERWQTERPALYAEFLKSYKLREDPRVTPPGRWLRRTSLDELPQLFNVLTGEMSLVGPRPIPEQQLRDQYGSAAKLYMLVRPGLTGLWQVSGRSETTGDQRVVYDEWYILNWTFWNDIVICLQTAWIIFSGHGAY
jgi:undecaprenyl-phosphate galactose phosphotransferase